MAMEGKDKDNENTKSENNDLQPVPVIDASSNKDEAAVPSAPNSNLAPPPAAFRIGPEHGEKVTANEAEKEEHGSKLNSKKADDASGEQEPEIDQTSRNNNSTTKSDNNSGIGLPDETDQAKSEDQATPKGKSKKAKAKAKAKAKSKKAKAKGKAKSETETETEAEVQADVENKPEKTKAAVLIEVEKESKPESVAEPPTEQTDENAQGNNNDGEDKTPNITTTDEIESQIKESLDETEVKVVADDEKNDKESETMKDNISSQGVEEHGPIEELNSDTNNSKSPTSSLSVESKSEENKKDKHKVPTLPMDPSEKTIIFDHMDRNWSSSSPEQLELSQLCFAAFGMIFESAISFPYSNSAADSSTMSGKSKNGETSHSAPWIPVQVVETLWVQLSKELFQLKNQSDNEDVNTEEEGADVDQKSIYEEILKDLTEQHNFLTQWDCKIGDDGQGVSIFPCLRISSTTYQDYAKYILEKHDLIQKEGKFSNLHAFMQNVLASHVDNSSLNAKKDPSVRSSSLILHQYALLNYPHHCILSGTKDLSKVAADKLSNDDFVKGRLELCGMLNGVEVQVEDGEHLVKSMENDAKEDQMHTMLFAYEAVAKECRFALEKLETMLEAKLKISDNKSTSSKEDEKSAVDDDDIDAVRLAVAKSLHLLGYSLSKTFGYNVTAPVTGSADGVSSVIKQQDIQYYQESLLLFSLLRPDPEVNLSQAETLFCLGNCYAYQKYVSLPISAVPSSPLSHVNFLKCSPISGTPNALNTKAMKCYDQSFYLRRTQKGNDHPIVSDSIHAIGVLYFEIENWSHAVGCFLESLRISRLASKHKSKENDLRIADTQEWIGYCERELGKHQSALTHFNEALVLRTLHLGKRHPNVATLLDKIGIVHDDLGETELSLEKYEESLSTYREFKLDADIERTLEYMGNAYTHIEKWEEALECLLESMDMQYKKLCEDIEWLKDVTQEDDEARTLPLPTFHNRDNRDGGSNRVVVISTSLDPELSAGLLRKRKEEEIERLLKHVKLLDQVYSLLTKLTTAQYDDMARVLYRKSRALIKLGKFKAAVKSLIGCKKACWLWEPTGNGLEFMVEVRLSGMHARLGHHEHAIQGYRELLNRCEKEDQRMSDILYSLGNSHGTLGEFNEALSCLQKCMRIRKNLGETQIEIANVNYCLGVVYCNLGRYDTSLTFLEDALQVYKEKLGPDHIHIAHTLYYLGQVYQSSENMDLENAMKYYEDSLEIYRIQFSPDHISLGHVMHSIGSIHDVHGDYPKAMLCYTDALRVYKLYNDGDHLGVATLMNSMGIVSACVRNQNDLAMTYFEEALRLRRKFLGKRHPAIADTVHNIGGVYAKLSEFEEALKCYEEALDIRREYYGSEHLVVAKTMNNLGIVYTRQNMFAEAMSLFKKVLMIRRMFLEPEDEEIATTLYNIGNIHSRTGEYDLAMVCYEEALRVRRILLGDSDVSVANMLHNMGSILADRKKYENAISVLDEALQIKRIELGDDSLSFSYTLQKIGRIHEDTEDDEKALACYEESLNIQRSHLGPDHLNIAAILMDVGNIRMKLRKFDDALECYEEALHIREMKLGEEHEDVANIFYAMGKLYDAQKEIEGAMICYGNSARILKKTRSSDDEERIKVTEALRKVISSHSKINGTMAAFWDTIVVTGDYWLGIEQLLLDLFEVLQGYILDPTKKVVKASIKKTMKEIETIASHGIVTIKESAAYGALYEDGLCLTSE